MIFMDISMLFEWSVASRDVMRYFSVIHIEFIGSDSADGSTAGSRCRSITGIALTHIVVLFYIFSSSLVFSSIFVTRILPFVTIFILPANVRCYLFCTTVTINYHYKHHHHYSVTIRIFTVFIIFCILFLWLIILIVVVLLLFASQHFCVTIFIIV